MPTEYQIRELAYAIWEQEGRPDGKDVEHYIMARQALEAKELAQASGSQQATLMPQSPRGSISPSRKRHRGS